MKIHICATLVIAPVLVSAVVSSTGCQSAAPQPEPVSTVHQAVTCDVGLCSGTTADGLLNYAFEDDSGGQFFRIWRVSDGALLVNLDPTGATQDQLTPVDSAFNMATWPLEYEPCDDDAGDPGMGMGSSGGGTDAGPCEIPYGIQDGILNEQTAAASFAATPEAQSVASLAQDLTSSQDAMFAAAANVIAGAYQDLL